AVEAWQVVAHIRGLTSVHPDFPEIPGPFEGLQDTVRHLDHFHGGARTCEGDQAGETQGFTVHLRIIAERRQDGTTQADVEVGARVGLGTAEFQSASGPVRIEADLAFRCTRRRITKEAIARPADRLTAFRAGRLAVELWRAGPEAREITLVVGTRVVVGNACASGSRGLGM